MSANVNCLPEALYLAGEREAQLAEVREELDALEYTGADEADAEWAYQEYQYERMLELESETL
jgi:hypothetical protein